MTVNDMICKMIAQAGGNKHDIAHFLKVYTYARLIGEKEQLDVRMQLSDMPERHFLRPGQERNCWTASFYDMLYRT